MTKEKKYDIVIAFGLIGYLKSDDNISEDGKIINPSTTEQFNLTLNESLCPFSNNFIVLIEAKFLILNIVFTISASVGIIS